MTRTPSQRPTAAEFNILRVLWERGPSTVREVHDALSPQGQTGYTGTLKLMQIMSAKGSVTRNDEQRAHVYSAADPPAMIKRQAAGDLVRRVFSGSASDLMMHALEDSRPDAEDLAEMRRMLDSYEKKTRS
jgi:predicted transcriptional regulator